MYTILTIETMAKRYKMLPSEVLERGNTYDLYIMDAAIAYHNYQTNKASGNQEAPPELTDDEMIAMMADIRQGQV